MTERGGAFVSNVKAISGWPESCSEKERAGGRNMLAANGAFLFVLQMSGKNSFLPVEESGGLSESWRTCALA
ncbi:hypothetical protein AN936_00790 [Sphingopyxis macrogoltabida]|uniref:Uncharacterized protein n=1 Tax=Sphingopyxis macrogoltabida TaxID=33050 RepID=A0A0N9U737_SPHMC|nr:hypothetical protein AN936_00790 [Sphingopyxis macrogoltabida]